MQSLFPSNLGDELLRTDFEYLDESGEMKTLQPEGGVMLASGNAPVTISKVTIYNADGGVYQTYDFTQMDENALELAGWSELPGSTAGYTLTGEGLNLAAQTAGYNGIYLNTDDMPANYKVVVDATRTANGPDGFYVGVGVTDVTPDSEDMVVYSINYGGNATGFKVYKDGVEGYTLGDYSVGTAAGNTYLTNYEAITTGTPYEITVDYGTTTSAGVGEDGRCRGFRPPAAQRLLHRRHYYFQGAECEPDRGQRHDLQLCHQGRRVCVHQVGERGRLQQDHRHQH